jgi:hypothetical protein
MPGSFAPRAGQGLVTTGRGGVPLEPGETSVGFQGNADGVWTLIYTRPGEVWTKEYPFKLMNVPLP